MNAYLSSNGIELWHVAGWTMVHFLWLGALVAAAAAVCRFFLRRTSPNIRYAFMLAWLIALAAIPIGTAAWIYNNSLPSNGGPWRAESRQAGAGIAAVVAPAAANNIIELSNPEVASTVRQPTAPGSAGGHAPNVVQLPPSVNPRQSQGLTDPVPTPTFTATFNRLESCIPYLPWLWLIGTPLTFALLLTGIVGTRRLGRAGRTITDGPIAELLAQLTASLRIGKRVTVAVCDRIAAPVLIGILRPIILLPPAALTGWSPDEIEMVLLHELAHVRRWDNLMNLLQRLVESLLFFHPAVWLISGWVRNDREACCDAVVVTCTNRPHAYAEMLVALAAQMPRSVLFHPAASSAMAAGPLRSRIRRILQLEDDPMLVSGKSLALMLGALLVTATLGVLYVPTIGQAEQAATQAAESTESKNELEKPAVDTVTNDDWPTGVVFPSPKEGEISKRAYELLGLKIVPATDDELKTARQKGFPSGLKVLNLPLGLHSGRGPAILVSLGRAPIVDFAALDHVVTETARGRMHSGVTIVELGGIAGSREFKGSVRLRPLEEVQIKDDELFLSASDALPKSRKVESTPAAREPAAQTAVIPGGRGALRPMTITPADQPDATGAPSKFPSLEDQKLADQAWKSLSLELEPIGADDLKRVKALGYDGGVKVVSGSAGLQGLVDKTIQPGDILVGLHVWPTKSMRDVATVLDREDLSELNPLKFYVVREESTHGVRGEPSHQSRDLVRTGRVSVKKPDPVPSPSTPDAYDPSTGEKVDPKVVQPPTPADSSSTKIDPHATLEDTIRQFPVFLAIFYSSNDPVPVKTYHEQLKELGKHFNDPQLGVAFVDVAHQGKDVERHNVKRTPTYVIFRNVKEVARLTGPQSVDALRDTIGKVKTESIPADKDPPNSDKSNLRYDGKTFDDWRSAWQTELSTEKRLEGIKALAAFGRAGFGKEASAAILDVAGEYDFLVLEGNQDPEGKLKETVLAELAPEYPAPKLATFWVPDLAARLEKDPKKWKWLAEHLSYRLVTDDPEVLGKLQAVAGSGPAELRGFALGALVKSARSKKPGAQVDDKTRDLIDAALQSKNVELVRSTLFLLPYYSQNMGGGGYGGGGGRGGSRQSELLYRPALLPLLFDSDVQTRRQACRLLQSIGENDAPDVVKYVLAVLKDKTRERDHIDAVRALAAIGGRAEGVMKGSGAVAELQKLAKHTSNNEMFIATLVALNQINGPSDVQFGSNQYEVLKELFDGESTEEIAAISQRIQEWKGSFKDQFQKELEVVANLPGPSNQVGGGGGFF